MLRAFDTNVLVRLIVQDDPAQARAAENAWARALQSGSVLIPLVTLVELAWVLRAGYKFDRMAIVDILRNLISIEGVAVEGEAMIRLALDAFAAGAADFSDYVILESSRSTGAEVVLTFDERFAKTPGVELLSS